MEVASPGPRGPVPVRVRGALGVPRGPGPHPVVAVPHGRHDPGCPAGPLDSETWPCFRTERRYDSGLRHVVAALARRGIVAVAPSLGAAFTAGWGEPDDARRWPRLVNRALGQLAREHAHGGGRFGVPLKGRLDLRRIGLLGHSLSGHHAVRGARRRAGNDSPTEIAAGKGPVKALFLLAPVAQGAVLPDVPAAIVVAGCDGDTGDMGHTYLRQARRHRNRRSLAVLARLPGANHNYFNRTLARQPTSSRPPSWATAARHGCDPAQRPRAGSTGRRCASAAPHSLRGSYLPARLRAAVPSRRFRYPARRPS